MRVIAPGVGFPELRRTTDKLIITTTTITIIDGLAISGIDAGTVNNSSLCKVGGLGTGIYPTTTD